MSLRDISPTGSGELGDHVGRRQLQLVGAGPGADALDGHGTFSWDLVGGSW